MRKDAPQLPLAWTTAGPARSSPELAPQYSGRGSVFSSATFRGETSAALPRPHCPAVPSSHGNTVQVRHSVSWLGSNSVASGHVCQRTPPRRTLAPGWVCALGVRDRRSRWEHACSPSALARPTGERPGLSCRKPRASGKQAHSSCKPC